MIVAHAALAIAFLVESVSPAPPTLDERFAPRHYVTAGHVIPVDARQDGVVVRADIDLATAELVVERARHAAQKGLPALREVVPVRDGALYLVWLEEDASSPEALVAFARTLDDAEAVTAVYPVLTRDGGYAVAADELLVTALPGQLDALLARVVDADLRLVRRSTVPDTALLTVGARHAHDAVVVSSVLKDSALRSAEPNVWRPVAPKATVDDPLHPTQWHLDRSGAASVPGTGQIFVHGAWDVTFGDPSVVVGVVDTGTDVDHEDLAANYVGGFDAVDGDDNPRPSCSPSPDGDGEAPSCPTATPYRDSHGTAVAGTILATANNGVGLSGVCPSCSLYAVRFLGGGLASSLTTSEMIIRATDDGVAVLNNSWGPSTSAFLPLAQAEKNAYAYARENGRDGKGMVIVFAAGNETTNVFRAPYAAHPYAIAVAASTNLDDWAAYSNYGREIDVAAPSRGGTVNADSYGISTTDVTGIEGYSSSAYHDGFGGTSASSPIVAGIAGLILTANPELTAEQVRLVLTSTADKITASQIDWEAYFGEDLEETFAYDENGHSIAFGWGRVNAAAAVAAATGFGLQGGVCTSECASCADDGTCELACEEQTDCVAGTLCEDGACRSPRPAPTDIGQPCVAECSYCTPAINSRYIVDSVCSASCTVDTDCPSGFECRTIAYDGTSICAVGSANMGARNFYRNCRFGEVVFDEAGRGYCSEMCFGNEPGDCPVGFHCGKVACECGLSSPWGCVQMNCTESVFGGYDYDLCVPDPGYGVTCEIDLECGPGWYCGADGACRVDDRKGCTICQDCASDDDCGPFERCITNEGAHYCSRGCEFDEDCPGGTVCLEFRTGNNRTQKTCRAPGDLPDMPTCDPEFVCEVKCRDDIPCDEGELCDEGACVPDPNAGGDGDGDGDGDVDEPEPDAETPPGCGCASGVDASATGALALSLLVVRRRRRRSAPAGKAGGRVSS